LNISEIVAQKHLLARITALEFAVAKLETRLNAEILRDSVSPSLERFFAEPEKRKPGRPRKNA
jgi:hypothetical protein